MIAIYKYPLEITDRQTVKMPFGARILTAQMQALQLCLWAEVETNESLEDRLIEIFGTGHPMEFNSLRRYIGTVQQTGGALVWHVFEIEWP